MGDEKLDRLWAARNRVANLMGFADKPCPHTFEIIRMIWGRYEALPISVEKLEAIAERIENLGLLVRDWIAEWEATWVDPDEQSHEWAELYARAKRLVERTEESEA